MGQKSSEKFNLNVPAGCLYSLLGSSGCGKTTVISIIMGLCKLDRGKVEVARSSRALGYMPQETCLYSEFSIYETLYYFGTLFGVCSDDDHINKKECLKLRINYLRKLLLLPPEDRIVGTLSGGQKRRLSLAVALVHEPDILLLDEPTCGLDPLVVQLIWEHLTTLVRTRGTTIILTTHNVDEAKYSNKVGFMRNGKLIAKDTPSNLFERFGVNSMESVFLALCQKETFKNVWWQASPFTKSLKSFEKTERQPGDLNGNIRRITALVGKNYRCTFRDIWVLLFIIAIPAVCMLCVCIGLKYNAHGITLGVVNYDVSGSDGNGLSCITNNTLKYSCRTDQLSCVFLESLEGTSIKLVIFQTIQSATEAVNEGRIWGCIHFAKNYTAALTNRIIMGSSSYYDESDTGKKEWNDSKIIVKLDRTNNLIYGNIISTSYAAWESSFKTLLKNCGYDEQIAEYPLQYMDPIFGTTEMTTFQFGAPGLAIELIYIFSLVTAGRFITEKRDGTLERCLAGGAQYWEILLSYAIRQSSVLFFQCILMIFVLYFGISVFTYLSNAPLVLILCWFQELSGLALGLLFAIFFNEEFQAAIAIIALVLPNAVVSGLIWPFEGLPKILQQISPYLPMTLSGEAARSMVIRGWGFDHPHVWQGFVMTLGYIVMLSFLTLILVGKRLRR